MDLLTLAQAVLGVAQVALPDVTRSYLAGGPGVAKVCTQLVVYPGVTTVTSGAGGVPIVGGCASTPVPQVVLAYSRDCYPMVEDGRPPRLPDPADVSDWTTQYMADCWALYDAILEAKYDGTLGDCAAVTVGPAGHSGPTGGVCTMQATVTVGP